MAGKAVEFTDENFGDLVLKSAKPVLVDFWAVWCGPCKAIAPTIEQIAGEVEGKAVVGKLDVDNNPEISMKYGIMSIPTLLVFKNGEIVEKLVGAVPKAVIEQALRKHTPELA